MHKRIELAHKPTPLWRNDALDELVGLSVWVKRDDADGGAEAGNKLRKLEYLMADALARNARAVITCGAVQSNHARATTLVARQLGLQSVVLLRTNDAEAEPNTGNLRLMRMCGARVVFISPGEYARRDELMREEAHRLSRAGTSAYVIPEGGSNGLGCLGYVDASRELRQQQRLGLCPDSFDTVVCACGSGGTTAGLALGIGTHGGANKVDAMAVCDDTAYFEDVVRRIVDEARSIAPELAEPAPYTIHDAYKGPAYGVMSAEQREFLERVAQTCGLIVDPTYSGKALFGLSRMAPKPETALFIHTGGLPGLLA